MLKFKQILFITLSLGSGILYAGGNVDWKLYGNGYENQRHSSLKQINHSNVKKLDLAWKYHTGKIGTFQASPVVVEGSMYLSTSYNDVVALNAETGKEIWRYKHQLKTDEFCCGPANRGVAVADDKVFQATIDGRLIALERSSGALLWDIAISGIEVNLQETLSGVKKAISKTVFDKAQRIGATGHSFNMAPQVFNGLVFVGSTGAGYGLHLDINGSLTVVGQGDGRTGLRGFLAAFDMRTGKEVWRWYSVTDEHWTGDWSQTTVAGVSLNRDIVWEKKQHKKFSYTWKLGGGSIITTPAIDAETGAIYFGTGNPAPNMEDFTRPGDNLHTSSIVALDSATGKLLWAFQQVPHDRWGYDTASPPVLFTVKTNGKEIRAVGQAGKTGWFYVLDRDTGRLLFKSEPFVPQHNLFANPSEEGVKIWPAIVGGSNWSPVAVNPKNNTVFIAGIHLPATYYSKKVNDSIDSPWQSYSYFEFDYKSKYGLLTAIDLNTGKKRWQHKTPNPLIGGVLHTDGELVFSGEGSGEFYALDEATGNKLWSYKTQYGVNAPPVTYQVNGKQYVAVAAGGNKLQGYAVGDELLVFALDKINED